LSVGAEDFYFFVVLHQFSQVVGKWLENQIVIPDLTYFHCPGATLLCRVKTLLSKEDSSVSILETMFYVHAEGIILPEDSNSNIVPSLLPGLGVNPEMLKEVTLDATMSWL